MQVKTSLLKAGVLVLGLIAGTTAARADQISFTGTDTFSTATKTINFDSAAVGVGGTGILSPFTTASTATFASVFNYGVTPANFQLFSVLAPNGATLTYDISAITAVIDNLEVQGTGLYTLTNAGVTSTATGTFDLTTQGNGSLTTFSDLNFATATTPEPNSLMLLGTGFVSAAGMLMRRRKAMAA